MERVVECGFEIVGLEFGGEGDEGEVKAEGGGEAAGTGGGGLEEYEGVGTGYFEA